MSKYSKDGWMGKVLGLSPGMTLAEGSYCHTKCLALNSGVHPQNCWDDRIHVYGLLYICATFVPQEGCKIGSVADQYLSRHPGKVTM